MASTDLSKFNFITVSAHSQSFLCMLKNTLSNRLIDLTFPTPDVTPYSSKYKTQYNVLRVFYKVKLI